jgi:hypothetical protein
VYVDKGHLAINQFSKISELDKQLLSVPEVLDALDKGNFSEEWFLGVKERIITACKQMSPDFKEPNIITLLIAGKLTLLQMDELKNNGKLAYFDRYNTTLLLNNVLTLDDVVNQTELYQCFNQEFVVYNWAPLYFVVIIVLISM